MYIYITSTIRTISHIINNSRRTKVLRSKDRQNDLEGG